MELDNTGKKSFQYNYFLENANENIHDRICLSSFCHLCRHEWKKNEGKQKPPDEHRQLNGLCFSNKGMKQLTILVLL